LLNSHGVWPCVYSNLVEIGPDNRLEGVLAESFESTPDAKTWTFRLRSGVEFSNGKTLDADDVIASINHHRGEGNSSAAGTIVAPIVDIRADGSNTVVIELEAGNADFPVLMTDYHLPIGIAQDNGTVNWQDPIGTGGYTIERLDYGVRMDVVRNPNYFRDGERAWFDSAELLVIEDLAAAMNAITNGEVDVIDSVDLRAMEFLQRSGDVIAEEVTGSQHYTFPMLCDVPPFNDVNVRLALKHAIDREDLVDKILFGHGRVAYDNPIAPPNRYFVDLQNHSYDPDRARFHLRQAGLDSLTVDLHASDAAFLGAVDASVLFSASAEAAGITINVRREPADGYWSNVWMNKPFSAAFWQGRPTEDWMFSAVYRSDASWNDTHWRNPDFDRLLMEARVELDEARRAEMYAEMQRMVSEDGGVIIPMYANFVWARNARVAHADSVASNWSLDGWRSVERWWFA
jgi:peptide/nickel transport system substrate-binding protein